ncbi:hypothetical protein BH10BDE1_BH10BDE1_13610 [soil metagenome]
MINIVWRLAPLPAILLAALVAVRSGVPIIAFVPNFVALAIGCAALFALDRWPVDFSKWSFHISCAVLALLATTLAFNGLDGVHRWIWMGPLSLNVSIAFAPILVFALRDQLLRNPSRGIVIVLGTAFLHALQPDAGQALVFAAGVTTLLLTARRIDIKLRLFVGLVALAGAVLTLLRPDDLMPVEHVEKILRLIANQGLPETIEMLFAMATLFAPFWIVRLGSTGRDLTSVSPQAMIATTFLMTSFVVPFIGNFPTPVFGAGLAGVLSWYALFALVKNS